MKSHRNRLLAKIHVLAKNLGLTEPGYRLLLYALTGKRSCAQLHDHELAEVAQFLAEEARRAK